MLKGDDQMAQINSSTHQINASIKEMKNILFTVTSGDQ